MFKNEKKLLICEEALIDYSGHFYSWIKAIKSINEDNSFHFKYEASPVIEDEIDDENFDEELDDISEFIHPEKSIVFNQPSTKNKLVKKLSIDEFDEKPALNQSNFSVIEYEKDIYLKHGKGTSL